MKLYPGIIGKLIFILFFQVFSTTAYADTLTIGAISSRPVSTINRLLPLVNYLSSALQPAGIDKVKIHIASNIHEMVESLQSGKIDLVMDSPFPSLKMAESGASKIVLRRWKKGVEKYHSVIFARKDSDINALEDLNGKMFGFEEEFSTSSYFIPKASMQQAGLVLNLKPDRLAMVSNNEVGYIFTDDDRNTVTWVRKKRIAAGVINNIKFNELKEQFKQELKIIYRSVSVPRQVVNFSSRLSPEYATAIKQALLDMDKTEKGKTQLLAFDKTLKFDEFPVAIDKAMAPLKKLAAAFK